MTSIPHRITESHGEKIRAFVPRPLPPTKPKLAVDGEIADLLAAARTALAQLEVAGTMVPSTDWFLYGFVRKEAVLTSQIEGTQATLQDVLTYEATRLMVGEIWSIVVDGSCSGGLLFESVYEARALDHFGQQVRFIQ